MTFTGFRWTRPAIALLAGTLTVSAGGPEITARLSAVTTWPVPVLFLAIAAATLVSEDLTCIACGLLVSQGLMSFGMAVAACMIGIMTGDLLLFAAGRWFALPFLHRRPLSWMLQEDDIQRRRQWFERYGSWIILSSRFLPGSRLPTFVAAGMFFPSIIRPALVFFIASLVWVPLLISLARVVGDRVFAYFGTYQHYALPVFLVTAMGVYLLVKVVLPLFTHKGRRLFLSSWRRATRWEFWPPAILVPPIVLYVIFLGLRRGCLTLFTAANPCMVGGGFMGESKVDILRRLESATDRVAPFEALPAGQDPGAQADRIGAFMAREKLGYPIVLKPDRGERGTDVLIVHDAEEQAAYLAAHRDRDLIVQAFAPGAEYGVFYVRHPNEDRGRIISITDKRFPTVTGDGRTTLERLILDDDRTVCQARMYLNRHRDHLFTVPDDGEVIPMVDIGTHCRGALFLDGATLLTPELEAAVDQISRGVDGFFFGRYDLRAPDAVALKAGGPFTIVELNGVTSEPTHIYQPGTPLRVGYRSLMETWRTACDIGEANMRRGTATPFTPREFFRMLAGAEPGRPPSDQADR